MWPERREHVSSGRVAWPGHAQGASVDEYGCECGKWTTCLEHVLFRHQYLSVIRPQFLIHSISLQIYYYHSVKRFAVEGENGGGKLQTSTEFYNIQCILIMCKHA